MKFNLTHLRRRFYSTNSMLVFFVTTICINAVPTTLHNVIFAELYIPFSGLGWCQTSTLIQWILTGAGSPLTAIRGVRSVYGPCTYRYFHFPFSTESEKWKMNNHFSFFILDEKWKIGIDFPFPFSIVNGKWNMNIHFPFFIFHWYTEILRFSTFYLQNKLNK